MAVTPPAALCWTSLLLCVHLVSASKDIIAELGEDATLPCEAPNNDMILAVEWTRGDLGLEYVFLFRDQLADPDNQHPRFRQRVEMVDSKMKNGDLSVRLKNVTTDDSGTYECHVIQSGTRRRKRASFNTDPISIITLNVEGQTTRNTEGGKNLHGHFGTILPVAGLIVVVVAVAVVGLLIYKKSKGHLKKIAVPTLDEVDVHQQLQNETTHTSDIQM